MHMYFLHMYFIYPTSIEVSVSSVILGTWFCLRPILNFKLVDYHKYIFIYNVNKCQILDRISLYDAFKFNGDYLYCTPNVINVYLSIIVINVYLSIIALCTWCDKCSYFYNKIIVKCFHIVFILTMEQLMRNVSYCSISTAIHEDIFWHIFERFRIEMLTTS